MAEKSIFVLDYSNDNILEPIIESWIPSELRVQTIHVASEEVFTDDLLNQGFTHVIHSGSELSLPEVTAHALKKARDVIQGFQDNGIPQFGICFGHQLLSAALLGIDVVRASPQGVEIGWKEVTFTQAGQQAFGVAETERLWQLHSDEVTAIPEGAQLLATSPHSTVQGFIHPAYKMLTTQFHPEINRETGNQIFLEYSDLFAKNHLNVDEEITKGPSINAGKVFFNWFLDW